MAVYFQLNDKVTKQPAIFQKIDDEMRAAFNAPSDPDQYYERWYDTVGFALALGHRWDKIKELFPSKSAIVDWLAERYEPDNWAGR